MLLARPAFSTACCLRQEWVRHRPVKRGRCRELGAASSRTGLFPTNAILRSVTTPQRLIVAITGATGAVYGVRLLEMLRDAAVETHLVISPWGRRTLLHE